MKMTTHHPSLLRALALLLTTATLPFTAAVPYPKDAAAAAARYDYLAPRAWSIWTVTVTETFTYSSWIPAATAPAGEEKCKPVEGSGQIACGRICCANWQYCAYENQCMANGPAPTDGSGGGGVVVATSTVTNQQTITTQFSAPYRVTSGTATATATETGTAMPGETGGAVSPGGTAGQLSGGAIAGIVIGTIAGVALLLLICACCVVRGLWHGLLALLGLGKKHKEKETIIEEERYARHGSLHSGRHHHGSWYGGGRPSSVSARKEKSKGAGLLGLGAALGTLALLLGLKRDKKKAPTKTRSDVSSSYWSESYTATSPSSRSSDRRTRHSRSARESRAGSRVTRTTHTHTRVSRSRAPSARSHRSPRSPR
ncbi:hypothetical protein VTI74DRAFT_450 [Chaetomium olivicolor]